jgi:hypothetical protein
MQRRHPRKHPEAGLLHAPVPAAQPHHHRQAAQAATRLARRVAQPRGKPAQLCLDAPEPSPDAFQALLI